MPNTLAGWLKVIHRFLIEKITEKEIWGQGMCVDIDR